MLTFDNVSYSYPSKPGGLRDLNIHIKKGDFIFVAASTAEYKTTFLNLIYGRVFPSSGKLNIFEFTLPDDKKKVPVIRKNIGYMFHQLYLFDNLTVRENLLIPMGIKSRQKKGDFESIVKNAIEKYPGLRPDTIVSELSSGEKQILNFIRALITDPPLFIADDPFKSIPKPDMDRFMETLEDNNRKGMTILISASSSAIPVEFNKPYFMLKNGRLQNVEA
jgi:cell division transport system ATP-binding protein